MNRSTEGTPYLLFALSTSLFALLLLAVGTLGGLNEDVHRIINYADTAICVLFLFDFLVTLVRSEKRVRYLATWGWVDLLSSIPMLGVLRVGRLVRVLRILRVLRSLRAGKMLSDLILRRRAQSASFAAVLIAVILLVVGSIAILEVERGPESNIKSPGDAIWWSVVTLTTVGYGDRYPTTTEGRVVAAFLMIAGVGLFGTLSGFIASWFLSPGEKRQETEIAQMRRDLAEVRLMLLAQSEQSGTPAPVGGEKTPPQ